MIRLHSRHLVSAPVEQPEDAARVGGSGEPRHVLLEQMARERHRRQRRAHRCAVQARNLLPLPLERPLRLG